MSRPAVTFVDEATGEVTRRCQVCREIKPLFDNFTQGGGCRKYNRNYRCKACRSRISKERHAKNVAEDEHYWRKKWLKSSYGLTWEQYGEFLESQGHRCAICGALDGEAGGRYGRLYVDHHHETGEVRGLLCVNCNTLLGLARESEFVLESAIKYCRDYCAGHLRSQGLI